MGGAHSRTKGAQGEREAAELWLPYYPHCKRQFPRQQQGVDWPDIGCYEMNKVWFVEVKRYAKIAPWQIDKWLKKLQKEVNEFRKLEQVSPAAVLMFRVDRRPWFVVGLGHNRLPIPWKDFTMLIKERAISRPPR